jgi:broad specificity phosphatase PhoE
VNGGDRSTRIIVVRHGQTRCNIENIWHGWDECDLTEEGSRQAVAVGQRLAVEPISAVYSSPSRRALRTAREVAASHGLHPILEEGLRERNAGAYEGVLVSEVEAQRPTIWEERNADMWHWRPPQGESFQEVLERTLSVVERVRRAHEGETVALATHMGPARVLLSRFTGIPLEQTYQMEFPSTSISIYRFEGDRVQVEAVNDAEHTRLLD